MKSKNILIFVYHMTNSILLQMQGIMTEYPTGLQFLNQHGDISLFADGFTALERKYLKYLLLRLNDRVPNISDIVVKSISKKDLHKVLQYPNCFTVYTFLI